MLRIGVRTGLLMAILFALMKLVRSRRSNGDDEWAAAGPDSWPPVQTPVTIEPPAPIVTERIAPVRPTMAKKAAPAKKAAATKKSAPAKRAAPKRATAGLIEEAPAPTSGRITWVEPTGRICPPSHPVKARLSSRIFHLPGMAAYNRTTPSRCYLDEATAVEDGFTKSKR